MHLYGIVEPHRKHAVSALNHTLREKWGIPVSGDTSLEEISRVLTELGYSLPDIAARRGDDRGDLSVNQQLDVERKERADLCEILAGMAQEKIRAIPKEDIFIAFERKTTVATAEHGTDYMAFKLDDTNTDIFPGIQEVLVLGESKYTSSTSDLKASCRATASWILDRLTRIRLYQELTNNADEYRRRGEDWKRKRTLGFIVSIFKRDEKLVVSSSILYDDSIPDVKAISDLQTSILKALDSHKEGSIPHNCFEALLFKVPDLESFCESCCEGFNLGQS